MTNLNIQINISKDETVTNSKEKGPSDREDHNIIVNYTYTLKNTKKEERRSITIQSTNSIYSIIVCKRVPRVKPDFCACVYDVNVNYKPDAKKKSCIFFSLTTLEQVKELALIAIDIKIPNFMYYYSKNCYLQLKDGLQLHNSHQSYTFRNLVQNIFRKGARLQAKDMKDFLTAELTADPDERTCTIKNITKSSPECKNDLQPILQQTTTSVPEPPNPRSGITHPACPIFFKNEHEPKCEIPGLFTAGGRKPLLRKVYESKGAKWVRLLGRKTPLSELRGRYKRVAEGRVAINPPPRELRQERRSQ